MKKYYTLTENGAIQHGTSGNACLDLFSKIGNMRKFNNKDILRYFHKAFVENPKVAVTIVFWARAVRKGSGERRVFEVIINDLMPSYQDFIEDNLENIIELGSFKDLVKIYRMNSVTDHIKEAIEEEFAAFIKSGNKLAMKWLPRKSELYSKVYKILNESNGLTRKEFRKLINGHTVETNICKKKFSDINYNHVPSLALHKYKKLFLAKDKDRFMKSIENGCIKASTLYPYQVVQDLIKEYDPYHHSCNEFDSDKEVSDYIKILDAQWKGLPQYNIKDTLVVVDTSGSMSNEVIKGVTALSISISLGLYAAEHTDGPWKNKMISFSMTPRLVTVDSNKNIAYKVVQIYKECEGLNTDIVKVFKTILNEAVDKKIKQEEMPKNILLISDMQFDLGVRYNSTLMNEIKKEYNSYGYTLPHIIYWNTSVYQTGVPIEENDIGTMVSGFSANLFKEIANNPNVTSLEIMNKILEDVSHNIDFRDLDVKVDPYVQGIIENINNPHETKVDVDSNNHPLNLFESKGV